jgi:D-psicose/D-tagatose/L-ribulose 3-epimerase
MSTPSAERDIYISFFMFTTNLQLDVEGYRARLIRHMKALWERGYRGFEFPIAPTDPGMYARDLDSYRELRDQMDAEGLKEAKIATNVMATRSRDPSSPYSEQRDRARDYLMSRIDITHALRGKIMMGPIVIPYGVYPVTDFNDPIWSDALQLALESRYASAAPVLDGLGQYAQDKSVKLAIEPITHWETPGPNKLGQLMEFLDKVPCKQVGVVIDSAHETLDGDGPERFAEQVEVLAREERLHYVQASAPDRGALDTCWLNWQSFLTPILRVYPGPIAVEIFNAVPAFLNSLRLTRRKFWIPEEDSPNAYPNAYETAEASFNVTRKNIDKYSPATT